MFWGLRLSATSPLAPAHTVPVGEVALPRADLTRIFGAAPVVAAVDAPPPELSSRFHLVGVVAPRDAGGPGIALIAVDGKTPRAYRVGVLVDGNMVLQSIERRGVALGPRASPAALHLDLPALPPPATGSLPVALNSETGAAAPANVPATVNMPLPVSAPNRPPVIVSPGFAGSMGQRGMQPDGMVANSPRQMPRLPGMGANFTQPNGNPGMQGQNGSSAQDR